MVKAAVVVLAVEEALPPTSWDEQLRQFQRRWKKHCHQSCGMSSLTGGGSGCGAVKGVEQVSFCSAGIRNASLQRCGVADVAASSGLNGPVG